MKKRREFLRAALGLLAGGAVAAPFLFSSKRSLHGEEQRVPLQRKLRREDFIHRNPAEADVRDLEITPLKDFQTMGATQYEVDPAKWRLEVKGRVKTPLILSYPEVLSFPSMERAVLLICPGFFANHGLWKGMLMEELASRAGLEKDAAWVTFASSEGGFERTERYALKEVLSGKAFLAYGVNGEKLPEKHGFPLRVVAKGHYGAKWIKYVSAVRIE